MAATRFVLAGAANSGITYLLYLALLQVLPYVAAYSVTYLAGIALGYALNAYLVFGEQPTKRSAAMFFLAYVLNYLMGLSLLYALVEFLGVFREIAPLLVLMVTVPIMYLMTKFIFKGLAHEKTVNK